MSKPEVDSVIASDPFEAESHPELVFGIIGPLGVDIEQITQTLSEELKRVGYETELIRLSHLIKEIDGLKSELASHPEHARIRSYMDAGTELRTRTGLGGILSRLAVTAIQQQRKSHSGSVTKPVQKIAYVLRSFKHRAEVEDLRGIYGDGLITISAYAPKDHRERALTDSFARLAPEIDRSTHRSKATELIERDEREEGTVLGQNVEGAFPLADLFVDASDRLKLQKSLRRFIEAFFGNHFITPSQDEFGIYQASAVARRSADLSRQVGAALTTGEGEIISVGCNDTPKAGGGLYWEGDEPAGRDFELFGYDPSEQAKREIFAELLDRLLKHGYLDKTTVDEGDLGAAADKMLSKELRGAQITSLLEFGRVLHAEMAAITDAARRGVSTKGTTLFCTTFPCHLCARLIIASGVCRVVFIEPYPKSKTKDLYHDSVVVDALELVHEKVNFQAFVGIAPRRYDQLFRLNGRRKGEQGKALLWNASNAKPRIRRFQASYISMETSVVAALPKWLQQSGLSWEK